MLQDEYQSEDEDLVPDRGEDENPFEYKKH